MLLRDFEGLVDALLDRDAWHDNHELREPVAPIQLEDGSKIDVGLPCARLHLHGEVTGSERARWRQAILNLNGIEVRLELVVEQGQPVSDAQVVLGIREPSLGVGWISKHRELRLVDFLPREEVANGFNGLLLIGDLVLGVRVGESELHRRIKGSEP